MAAGEMTPLSRIDGIMCTLYAIAVLTTLLRVYCRRFVLHAFGADDALIVIAMLIGACTVAFHHKKLAPLEELNVLILKDPTILKNQKAVLIYFKPSIKFAFVQSITYVTGLAFIKLAILAFYRRVVVARNHHYVLYLAGACIVGFTIAFDLATIFQLDPARSSWDLSVPIKRIRVKPETLDTSNSGFQIAMDVILLVLPISVVLGLNTNRKAKAGLVVLFSLGIFALVATIVRLVKSVQFEHTKDVHQSILKAVGFSIWTEVELNVAMICANLPALWTLLKWLSQGRQLTKPASNSYQKYNSGSTPVGGGAGGTTHSDPEVDFGRDRAIVVSSVSGGRILSSSDDTEMEKTGLRYPGAITRKTEFSMNVDLENGGHNVRPPGGGD